MEGGGADITRCCFGGNWRENKRCFGVVKSKREEVSFIYIIIICKEDTNR